MAANSTFFMAVLSSLACCVLCQVSVSDQIANQDTCYCLRQVVNKLDSPVSTIFFKEDGQQQVLVVEQIGMVVRYKLDGSKVGTFMDIRDRVVTSESYGESRGLLSMVLDPLYEKTGRVFAYYIRNVEGKDYAYVSMFKVENGIVNPNTEMFYLRMFQPYTMGNGGPMLFGDDGYLYIMTGDGGEEDDPKGNAQNKNSFHGKILRIDVDGPQDFTSGESGVAKMYAIPPSNPFVNSSDAKVEIFALGIRNMWGCTLDSSNRNGGTGRIICAETGTNRYDEINIIERGGNYGWNVKEGTACVKDSSCETLENEKLPVYEFKHNNSHSLVGGHMLRSQAFPWMNQTGFYTFGDVVTGKTYLLQETNSGPWKRYDWPVCESKKCETGDKEKPFNHILSFGQDMEGQLYLLTTDDLLLNSDTAKMLKIVPPHSAATRQKGTVSMLLLCVVLSVLIKKILE